MKPTLFYLSNSLYGGWVSFSYHLAKVIGVSHVVKVKDTFNGGGVFYGDINYKNCKPTVLHKIECKIILAVDKQHVQFLKYFSDSILIIHDPTEFHEEVLSFAKRNTVITIRKTVHEELLKRGIENIFLKHPFYKYPIFNLEKKYNRALSRVDFDKNTDIICKANNLGADIEIYGYKNHIYYFHKLRELGFDNYYKGSYSRDFTEISLLYGATKFMVDLSTIKNDGGGTQYTFLEAEHHGCGLILHTKWCERPDSIYKNGINCYTVSNEMDLLNALKLPILKSNNLPTEEENKKWKELI